METMRATYSPEDNKLRLYSSSRLDDETYQSLKAAGFRWAPKQAEQAGYACLMVAPMWTPAREDLLLDLCEEIEDEDYSPEERAADRAERFSGYREKRAGEAGAHADTFEAGPSAFGHQSRARAERQAARHDRQRVKAVSQWSKAEYWQSRTAGVIAHALHKSDARTRRGRILTLEAEQRRNSGMSPRWQAHYELRLGYERQMLENEGGMVGETEIEPGGWIRPSRRDVSFGHAHVNAEGFAQVLKVFKSPATGRITSVQVLGADPYLNDHRVKPRTINVERLGEDAYRAPTDEERATFADLTKERKKAAKAAKPPTIVLINPTDEDAERLQAIWNAEGKARHERVKAYGDYKPSEVRRMTQAQYSEASKGSYASCTTAEISEQLKQRSRSPMGRDRAGRVTIFKIRRTSSSGFNYGADRVIIVTDKPQQPIPWEAAEAAREKQPTKDKLFHRLDEIQRVVGANWLPEDGTPESDLLNDAHYVGWVTIQSCSQFSLTESGWEAWRKFQEIQNAGGVPVLNGTLYPSPEIVTT